MAVLASDAALAAAFSFHYTETEMRWHRRRAACTIALAFFPAAVAAAQAAATGLPRTRPEDVGLSSAALARIAPALKAYTDSGRLPGIIVAVARHGKLAHLEAVGAMDIARGTPMRTDAVFRIYSMTKAVTGVAIAQLIERGKVRLEDPVSKYIPAFAHVQVYAGGPAAQPTLRAPARPITIAHLMTHSAGLTYGSFGNTTVDSIYRRANVLNASRTIGQFADSIAKLPLLFEPGTRWNYSMAMDVLGRVVEVASGKSFDRYLEDELFAPLGMRETAFHATPTMEGRIATLYGRGPGGVLRASEPLLGPDYRADGKVFAGGQGLLSTVADYLRFTQMLMNGGELDGRRVLEPKTVDLIMKNHMPPELTPITPPPLGNKRGYGQGFGGVVMVDSVAAAMPTSPGVYRWCGYAGTFFWIDRAKGLTGMLWTQLAGGCPHAIEGEFERLVYNAIMAR
jgi:CubicO group peptidase (beta-lactamase class C family)